MLALPYPSKTLKSFQQSRHSKTQPSKLPKAESRRQATEHSQNLPQTQLVTVVKGAGMPTWIRSRSTLAVLALLSAACMPPEWGANALLNPWRRPLPPAPRLAHEDVAFTSEGLTLRGWLFRAEGPRQGLIVYLHGISDNRQSGVGVAQRFVPGGYDVFLYDSRAHGTSDGKYCTYGFHEKRDLSAALDALKADRAIVFGSSLGAAVALQAAAVDARIVAVIAQSSFSDLRAIVEDRAPWIATRSEVDQALALAEARGEFKVAEASPRAVAGAIRVPVLLLHGERDRETRPEHSRRIFDALTAPKRLILVPAAGHNDVLGGAGVWGKIEEWLGTVRATTSHRPDGT